jgi:hypothetical protein
MLSKEKIYQRINTIIGRKAGEERQTGKKKDPREAQKSRM